MAADTPDSDRVLARLGKRIDEEESWRTQQVIDQRFRLIAQIGYGTFGKVFEAVDTLTGQQVAVKLFNADFKNSGYLQELGLLFGQTHKHIVDVLSFGYSRGQKYLVYEFVPGGSLRDFMARYPRLDVEIALAITCQVVAGLGFAHDHEVVHRDLKPENILLTRPEWPFEIKLCDFGLAARCRDQDRLQSSFGSTAYMAPEQFREDYDARVDLYAAGVVLYEMLFGQRPYRGDAASILYAHQHSDLTLPEQGPEPVLDLLRHALAKDPDDRYSTCPEMIDAITEAKSFVASQEILQVFAPPAHAQPVLQSRWKTRLPFEASRLAVTRDGQLAFAGRNKIFTVNRDGTFRQLFRLRRNPDLIVEGGQIETNFAWLEDCDLVIWSAEDDFTKIGLDQDLALQPLQILFSPTGSHLLVISPYLTLLYDEAGQELWRAEINSYGMLPAATFSSCGEFVWLASDIPQTHLICLSLEGEKKCRIQAGHHEVVLLGYSKGRVLLGEKNRTALSLVNPEGFIEAKGMVEEEMYSLLWFDQETILVNSVSHLELLDGSTLASKGFINTKNPFDQFFGVEGGFYQVSSNYESTELRFSELKFPGEAGRRLPTPERTIDSRSLADEPFAG